MRLLQLIVALKGEEVGLILMENDFVRFSFCESRVYSFDRFESKLACVLG